MACNCNTCKRGKTMEIHISDMEAAGLDDAAEFLSSTMTKLFNAEMDLGYYKMIVDGRWPTSCDDSEHARNKMN